MNSDPTVYVSFHQCLISVNSD